MIDREALLKEYFSKYDTMHFTCPKCSKGQLRIIGEGIKLQTADSLAAETIYDWGIDQDKYHYANVLRCSSAKCKESVIIACIQSADIHIDKFHQKQEYILVYKPLFFHPNLKLFSIPDSCPVPIREQLDRSFSHYFLDLSASANALRSALELILDYLKVPRNTRKNGKVLRLNLSNRINKVKLEGGLSKLLHASRVITNYGSHSGQLRKEDIIDGYEFVEMLLSEIFTRKEKLKIMRRAAVIAKRKAPKKIKRI